MKIKTKGTAKIQDDGSMLLTDGLQQTGRVTVAEKVSISKKPWRLSASVTMSDNQGLSDSDGKGGDGIWFEFNEKTFSIGLDTFYNDYNDSGNEVNLFLEGQIIAKEHCPVKLNSGETIKVDIVCIPSPRTMIVVAINEKPVLMHALKTTTLADVFPNGAEFSVFAFTGEAGSKQVVHEVELKNISIKAKL